VSWGLDLPEGSEWRSKWPKRRIWDSIGFAKLDKSTSTIEAYLAVVVNIWMEHLCHEAHGWRFRRILFRKLKLHLEQTALPYGLFWTFDESCPFEEIPLDWGSVDALLFFAIQLFEVFY